MRHSFSSLCTARLGVFFSAAFFASLFVLCVSTIAFAAEFAPIVGKASWYGSPPHARKSAHGKTTASGRVFDRTHFTAAHRTLPFGTVLRVYNLANFNHVLVVVSDRGPFVRGRHLDVSYRAARMLNFVRRGVAKVRADVVSDAAGVPLAAGDAYFVQFAVQPDKVSAQKLQRDIRLRLKRETNVLPIGKDGGAYSVSAGSWRTFREAEEVLEGIPLYYSDAQIILRSENGTVLSVPDLPEAAKHLRKKRDSHKKNNP